MKKIQIGDRIKLLVPTIGGWKGCGTVTEVFETYVMFTKDNRPDTWLEGRSCAGIEEVKVIKRRVDN